VASSARRPAQFTPTLTRPVKGVSPDRGGEDYNFTVDTYETDAFEPNEERANATEISVEEEVSGTVSVGDEDWSAVTVERGETINVTAAATNRGSHSNTEFDLVTPDGDFPGGARLKGETGFFGTTATTSDTYYIRARGVSSDRSKSMKCTSLPERTVASATPGRARVASRHAGVARMPATSLPCSFS